MTNILQIKKDFPILKRVIKGKSLVYLDNAATSQKPMAVIKAMSDYYENNNANVHRGVHFLSEEASNLYEESRKTVADFIGANGNELVFVSNTTEAINLVAWAWAFRNLKKGDEILTTITEHHSNFLPWQAVASRKGLRVKVMEVDVNGRIDLTDWQKQLSSKVKLVAINQMSNVTGVINPVKKIAQMANKAGARVLVDAAQSVPHMTINVKDLNVDFLAFSGHKMLGPMGIGGLYIKKERQIEMGVFLTGGGMINEVYKDKPAVWAEGVEKWEAGTPNVAGAVGLAEAVNYLKQIGMDKISKHERELSVYALKEIKTLPGMRIVGPDNGEMRGGVISLVMKGVHAHDAAEVLNSEGVAVRSGHHCAMPLHEYWGLAATVRASFYLYNDRSDVDRLIKGLEKTRKVFR